MSVSQNHKKPAALVAATTLVALVATTASVPTAQADAQSAAGVLVSTELTNTDWPASPAVYGTQRYVSGTVFVGLGVATALSGSHRTK